jgi:L-seryl-tRNA(Ser) seleniumtransferase
VDAVTAGADLVIFSGDKLLGGPQAGCIVGQEQAVAACALNPLARALRADKLTLAALEATLHLYRDPERAIREIPVLAMLTMSTKFLQARATELAAAIPPTFSPTLVEGASAVGGGAFPDARLPTTLVRLDPGPLGASGLALRLRLGESPVIVRVEQGYVFIDPRTVDNESFEALWGALDAIPGA